MGTAERSGASGRPNPRINPRPDPTSTEESRVTVPGPTRPGPAPVSDGKGVKDPCFPRSDRALTRHRRSKRLDINNGEWYATHVTSLVSSRVSLWGDNWKFPFSGTSEELRGRRPSSQPLKTLG